VTRNAAWREAMKIKSDKKVASDKWRVTVAGSQALKFGRRGNTALPITNTREN
jgi:hypothetical protein